jgi:polyhydroxyalkanoate synthesis regulator phasin
MDPPPVQLLLAPSPATRVPIFGKLWQTVRGQFHELILFYVNRAVSHEIKLDNHIISALNELTRIIQEQQQEIDALHEQIRQLEEDHS